MSMYPSSFPTHEYMLNAALDTYKRSVDKARAVISEVLGMGISWYVAWSGGKDSTALAHLVNTICPDIPIWSEKDDCDFPGELEYVRAVAEKYNFNLTISTPENSLWDEIDATKVDIFEDLHSRGTAFSDRYFYSEVAKQEALYDGVFLGLRADESKGRLWNYKKQGCIYQRKNGKYTCIPLANWSGTDVFSYLVTNEIPILDVYFKTKFTGGDPTQIRKAWMLPSARACSGYCAWLKYYYPEHFRKMMMKFPQIKSYI